MSKDREIFELNIKKKICITIAKLAIVAATDIKSISISKWRTFAFKKWKGLGGTNAKSTLKIQVMFNILTKIYKKIDIVDATENDSKYMTEIVK